MKYFIFLCLLFIEVPLIGQFQKIAYSFRYDSASSQLIIDCNFKGNHSGKTKLILPDNWAGQKSLWKSVKSITLHTNGVRIDSTSRQSEKVLFHSPNQSIRISYSLSQDWKGNLVYPNNYRAIINNEYVQCTGHSILIHPVFTDKQKISVKLDWRAMPSNWNIANSFHSTTKFWEGNVNAKDLINALFVAGDFRILKDNIKQKPIVLAIRGKEWKFADSLMLQQLKNVVLAERIFWNDFKEPYYLVTMNPFFGNGLLNGTSLHQAFLTGLTTEFSINPSVLSLIAHEYFHNWNGTFIHMEGSDQTNAWFSEGFTEYYTYKILFSNHLIDTIHYLHSVNKTIDDYYLSNVRNADNLTASKNFWTEQDYQQLPYKKGFVYALYLDQLIQNKSVNRASLNSLMLLLLDSANKGSSISVNLFIDGIKQLAGVDINELHEKFIHQGQTIPIEAGSLGLIFKDSVVNVAPFELGFDYAASNKLKQLVGVTENSNAWKAGLRNGLPYNGASVYFGNSTIPVDVYVVMSGKNVKINYLPISMNSMPVRHFYLPSDQSQ
jgi:predicted metalloprotease with PDZ domain